MHLIQRAVDYRCRYIQQERQGVARIYPVGRRGDESGDKRCHRCHRCSIEECPIGHQCRAKSTRSYDPTGHTTRQKNQKDAPPAANTATTNASNATAAAIEAKEDCEEVIAAAAELEPLNLVPTAMTVEYPSRLLVGNMAENFIRATLTPASVKPNVLFLGDDKAVSVTPDGRITILAAGTSIIHVIPTCNVALYKTIQIKVSKPTVRLVTLSSIRLTANGNFRFN